MIYIVTQILLNKLANLFLKSFHCPHCDTKCSFFGSGVHDCFVLKCTGCNLGVYFQFEGYNVPEKHYERTRVLRGTDESDVLSLDPDKITDYYPKRNIEIDQSIPSDIANDFIEASKCYETGSIKATVSMCRRSLQSACLDKGAKHGDLIDQIDELERNRIISPSMKDVAHTIRIIGNWGAHPQKDSLKTVNQEDAEQLLEFISEFFDEIYIRQAKLIKLKKSKTP